MIETRIRYERSSVFDYGYTVWVDGAYLGMVSREPNERRWSYALDGWDGWQGYESTRSAAVAMLLNIRNLAAEVRA